MHAAKDGCDGVRKRAAGVAGVRAYGGGGQEGGGGAGDGPLLSAPVRTDFFLRLAASIVLGVQEGLNQPATHMNCQP